MCVSLRQLAMTTTSVKTIDSLIQSSNTILAYLRQY